MAYSKFYIHNPKSPEPTMCHQIDLEGAIVFIAVKLTKKSENYNFLVQVTLF